MTFNKEVISHSSYNCLIIKIDGVGDGDYSYVISKDL